MKATALSVLPGNKSFTLNLDLLTYDRRISPMIDLNHSSVVFVSNRVDGPITNFATDPRVVGIPNDPNSMIYVTKQVTLENPATSLKVFIDAYIANTSDVRMFYALDQDVSANETKFKPFPGIDNIDPYGQVINPAGSDGTPDTRKEKSDKLILKHLQLMTLLNINSPWTIFPHSSHLDLNLLEHLQIKQLFHNLETLEQLHWHELHSC